MYLLILFYLFIVVKTEFLKKRELNYYEKYFNSKVESQLWYFKCLRLGTQTPIAHRIYPASKFKDIFEYFIRIIDRSTFYNKKVLKSYIKTVLEPHFSIFYN